LAVDVFLQALRDLGWIDGQNVHVEMRVAPTVDRLPELAAELVRMNVDVIFASSSTFVEAARQATKTIPIVFSAHNHPVGVGHVASLAHPGGNITGLSQLQTELAAKQLEMLKEAVPQATRISVLWNPTTPSHPPALKSTAAAAEKLGIQLQMVPARTVDELEEALSTMTQAGAGAFLAIGSPLVYIERVRLAELSLKYRLPSMSQFRVGAEAGGLMSYGPDINDLYRRAAIYVDKILKGTKTTGPPLDPAFKNPLLFKSQNVQTPRPPPP